MVTKGLFFDQTFFYEETPVDENVDWHIIRPVIWNCQKVYVEDIIGTPLYDVIEAEIISNAGALTTGRLVTLTNEYIVPCLVNYCMMELTTTLTFKFKNRSLQTQRSSDSDEVTLESIRYIKAEYKDLAEKFAEKIQRYLQANSSTFPEYTTYTSSDQVRAMDQKPTVGVYLPGMEKYCPKFNL